MLRLQRIAKSSWPSWLAALPGVLWLALFPLWHDETGYTKITHAKWYGMQVLTAATIAIIICTLLAMLIFKRGKEIRLHPLQGIALAYLGWLCISAFYGSWSDHLNSSAQRAVFYGAVRYEGLFTQICYVNIFLLCSCIRAKMPLVLGMASEGIIIFFIIMMLQYSKWNVFELFPGKLSVYKKEEFQGTMGNIDMISAYLSLMMPILLSSYILRGPKQGGWLHVRAGCRAALILLLIEVQSGIIVLMLTMLAIGCMMWFRPELRSRGTLTLSALLFMFFLRWMVALPWYDGGERIQLFYQMSFKKWALLAVSLAGFVVAYLLKKHPGKAFSGKILLALALVAVIAAGSVITFVPMPKNSALWEMQEVLHGRAKDSFGSERIGIWRMTLDMSKDSLLFGTGPDTFVFAMRDYMARTSQRLRQSFDNPHNILLAILSGSGIPALALFVLLIAGTVFCALRTWRRDRRSFALPLMLGVMGFLIQGMFTFSVCLVSPMFWCVLGMTVCQLSKRKENQPVLPKEPLPEETDAIPAV